jgi:hypothetical protein
VLLVILLSLKNLKRCAKCMTVTSGESYKNAIHRLEGFYKFSIKSASWSERVPDDPWQELAAVRSFPRATQ